MKLFTKLMLAIAPLFIVALGCSNMIPGNANLFEGDNAAKAAAAIKQKAGTDKVNVIRVEIRPDVMKVTIQSPTNPKEQDQYTYQRGSASGPEPVQIQNVFANYIPPTTEISEINFAALPATIKRAIELAQTEEAKVDLISMDSEPAATANPKLENQEGKKWALTWRIFVKGTRLQKYFWADKQGNLNEKGY